VEGNGPASFIASAPSVVNHPFSDCCDPATHGAAFPHGRRPAFPHQPRRAGRGAGHAAGDAAIRALTERLKATQSGDAFAGRLGGDEFVLRLPAVSIKEVRGLLESLGSPSALPELPEAGPQAVAASLGLAQATAAETDEALIARVDAQMYRRKTDKRAA